MNRPLCVLVIEDMPTTQHLWLHWLGTDTAITGMAVDSYAMALEATVKPNVVVLDLELPNGLGLDLFKKIRDYFSPAAIVVATGQPWCASFESTILSEGAEDYLTKEKLSREVLIRSVRHAAIRHAARLKFAKAEQASGLAQVVVVELLELTEKVRKSGTGERAAVRRT
jgi:CheY-like chemotaxis protein